MNLVVRVVSFACRQLTQRCFDSIRAVATVPCRIMLTDKDSNDWHKVNHLKGKVIRQL